MTLSQDMIAPPQIINTIFEQYDTSLRQQALGTTSSGTFSSVSYNAGADETTLTHTGQVFTGMEGFDAKIFITQGGFQIRWLEILSVPNADQIVVAGDQTPSNGNVIYSIYAPAGIHSGGIWTAESFAAGITTLTTTRNLPDYAAGWSIQIDATIPAYYEVLSVSGNTISIDGDLTSFITPDATQFNLIHPSGVNPETGATQTDPCVPESRYYWGGGYYLPPIVGFEMLHYGVFGIHGAQPGPASGATPNLSGQHYMHNRIYDINTGRWTSPDPAASPYWNLQDYVGGNPINRSDPSGLVNAGLISEYWRVGNNAGNFVVYGEDKCEQLLSAIKLARYDLSHASLGMGGGRLPEIIKELELLYAKKCGRMAPPSAYTNVPAPDYVPRHCQEQEHWWDREAKAEILRTRVRGWELLGDMDKGVAAGAAVVVVVITAPVSVPLIGVGCVSGCPAAGPASSQLAGPGCKKRLFETACMMIKEEGRDTSTMALIDGKAWMAENARKLIKHPNYAMHHVHCAGYHGVKPSIVARVFNPSVECK